ncbi:MAG: hypothetical protein ACOYMK_14565 [Hyphomonadaceae bacterium]
MSRLTISAYQDLEAQRRRREAQLHSALLRALDKLDALARVLEPLDEAPASCRTVARTLLSESLDTSALSQLEAISTEVSADLAVFERAILQARTDRERLAMSARSLSRSAAASESALLSQIIRQAASADKNAFVALRKSFEDIVTRRILDTGRSDHAAKPAGAPLSGEAAILARALMGPADTIVLPQTPLPDETNRAITGLERLLETLGRLGPEGDALRARADQLLNDLDARDFQLKLDSLNLDGAELIAALRAQSEVRNNIAAAVDALAPFDDPSSTALRIRLAAAESLPEASLRDMIDDATSHARHIALQEDARRARAAIIAGLQTMGYEIEQSSPAWQPGERISARRPEEPNYDVQLAAMGDGKVQAKVRAFVHSGRSANSRIRDREVEERWCTDILSLHERLEQQGLGAMLQHDEAPGSSEVVLVEKHDAQRTGRTAPVGRKATD